MGKRFRRGMARVEDEGQGLSIHRTSAPPSNVLMPRTEGILQESERAMIRCMNQ